MKEGMEKKGKKRSRSSGKGRGRGDGNRDVSPKTGRGSGDGNRNASPHFGCRRGRGNGNIHGTSTQFGRGSGRGDGNRNPTTLSPEWLARNKGSSSDPAKAESEKVPEVSADTETSEANRTSCQTVGKNHARNSRQKANTKAKSDEATARADACQKALSLCLLELEVVKEARERDQDFIVSLKRECEENQDLIASLRRENDALKAKALVGSGGPQGVAADAATLGSTVQDLDSYIESMDS